MSVYDQAGLANYGRWGLDTSSDRPVLTVWIDLPSSTVAFEVDVALKLDLIWLSGSTWNMRTWSCWIENK